MPCGDHEVAVRIFAPRDSLPQTKILLFFHGGGWVTGNIDSYDKTCHVMANKTGAHRGLGGLPAGAGVPVPRWA